MASFDIVEILDMLPHRAPMVMVDRIIECNDLDHIVGLKNIAFNEPYLQGHFPGAPIMPGVLQIEAMAQVGGVLLARKLKVRGVVALLMAVDKAKFRNKVVPGDQMRIEVHVMSGRGPVVRCSGKITVDGKPASGAELLFMYTDQKVNS